MKHERPRPDEYAESFAGYVARVPESDVIAVLTAQRPAVAAVLAAIPEERAGHRYAEGKWSIREVVGHVVDTERVMGYRALCVARGETASLPAFDENLYAARAGHDGCRLADLARELDALRESHLLMLRHVPEDAWARFGTANARPVTPRALAYVIAGHLRHHFAILAERYGTGVL